MKHAKLDTLSIILIFLSFLILILAFIAPEYILNHTNLALKYKETGQVGDTLQGLMGPLIAISGVLMTFLAFYIQYKANKLQQSSFREELNEQRDQFVRNQFENQFFEMIKLHKENVNELELNIIKVVMSVQIESEKSEGLVKGRHVFDLLIRELELIYLLAKQTFPKLKPIENLNTAYHIFFHGINGRVASESDFIADLKEIQASHKKNSYSFLKQIVKNKLSNEWEYDLNYPIFSGHSSQLAHYFRHLFMTVKYVTSQPEEFLSYENKRKYLRILRAQLSNLEQAMIFYNWFSKFGAQWENDKNKFFTDYRMIHNLYQELLIPDIEIEELFDVNGSYRKEKNRISDPLFEFQDWSK